MLWNSLTSSPTSFPRHNLARDLTPRFDEVCSTHLAGSAVHTFSTYRASSKMLTTTLIESLGYTPELCKASVLHLSSRTDLSGCISSEDIDLEMGTPQGSPVSPVLSIIYASPLLHLARCWMDAAFSMYVDDGNIFARAPTYCVLGSTLVPS